MAHAGFVPLANAICIVCGRPSNLFNTEPGMCEKHAGLYEQGYIALIGIDPDRSRAEADGTYMPYNAWRTGEIVHVKEAAYCQLINSISAYYTAEVPPEQYASRELRIYLFVDSGTLEDAKKIHLKALQSVASPATS